MVRIATYPVTYGISYPMDVVLFWIFLQKQMQGYSLGISLASTTITVGMFTTGERKYIQEYCQ